MSTNGKGRSSGSSLPTVTTAPAASTLPSSPLLLREMSAPSLFRNPAIWGVAFLAIACAATATFLPLLNGLSPLFYDPEDLPRSERDPRVHFEAGANFCAAEVAALLPRAIQHVEAMQGRPFARDPVVAVYSSPALFAKANGFGHPNVAGASQWGRITLSPRLCTTERPRLAAVLTHELSHAHLLSWRSWYVFERPPSWFSEGLAVMVSGGGGAEGVDEEAAAQALLRGYAIAIQHKGRWLDFAAIPFRIEPLVPSIPRQRLAYRQAAMFVNWLLARRPSAFYQLLHEIESGKPFSAAFLKSYGLPPESQWQDFVSGLAQRTL